MLEAERLMQALIEVTLEYTEGEEAVISEFVKIPKGLVEAKFVELGGNHYRWRIAKGQILLRYRQYMHEDKYYIYIQKNLLEAWRARYKQESKKEEEEVDKFLDSITSEGEE